MGLFVNGKIYQIMPYILCMMYNETQHIGVWGLPQIGGNIRRAALPIDGPWARMAAGVRRISPARVLLLADRAAARLRHYAAYATQLGATTPGRFLLPSGRRSHAPESSSKLHLR